MDKRNMDIWNRLTDLREDEGEKDRKGKKMKRVAKECICITQGHRKQKSDDQQKREVEAMWSRAKGRKVGDSICNRVNIKKKNKPIFYIKVVIMKAYEKF